MMRNTYVRQWSDAVRIAIALGMMTGRKQRVRSLETGGWTFEAAA
jgi:hypothetical protein